MADTTWLINGKLIAPDGLRAGAVAIRNGRIAAIHRTAPGLGRAREGQTIDLRGRYLAPGLVDLHVWGDPSTLAREVVAGGCTAFVSAIGPETPEALIDRLEKIGGRGRGSDRAARANGDAGAGGARWLGAHLEGPFVNPAMAGALPKRWMRPPVAKELRQLGRHASRIRMVTMAPELAGAIPAIRWMRKSGILVSLGHSQADAATTQRAVDAGASIVTHLFNGMRPFHHREPGLVGIALTDPRIHAMVILDGAHIGREAFNVALRCKGANRLILVTDSIRYEHEGRHVDPSSGAYVLDGKSTLAGSRLTMIEAVRRAVEFARIPVSDAIRMASLNPARLVGRAADLGSLEIGKRADLIVFDSKFQLGLTLVGGVPIQSHRRA